MRLRSLSEASIQPIMMESTFFDCLCFVRRSLGALTSWPTDLFFRSLREREARSLRVVTLQDFAFTQSRYACAHACMFVYTWETLIFVNKHFHGCVFRFHFPRFLIFKCFSASLVFQFSFHLGWETDGTSPCLGKRGEPPLPSFD